MSKHKHKDHYPIPLGVLDDALITGPAALTNRHLRRASAKAQRVKKVY